MTFHHQAKQKSLARTAGSLSLLASALLLAWPAQAQSNEELLREIRALKDRVQQLEGARTEQAQELSRVGTKAEALEDTRDAMGLKNLKISGYADPTFIANKRQNTTGFQFLNGVGDDGYNYDNSYFGAVAIDFQKETDSGSKYRLTLIPNRGTESIASGSNGIVQEASVAVPLDSGLYFIAGHLPDWSGYEYSQPTLNKLITHNLLFDFTLPTSYTGAGVQLSSGKWIVKSVLANMNASKKAAGEKTPVLAYRADYTGGEFYGLGFAGVHGKAANFAETLDDGTGTAVALKDSRVDLFEVDAWFTRGDWNFNGQVSVGRQRKSAIATANGTLTTLDPAELLDAKWWGLSGLASYKVTPRLEGILRADYINNKKNGGGLLGYATPDDRNGIGSDPAGDPTVGANRTAISVGLAYALDPSAVLKAEVRRDSASQPVFIDVKDGSFSKTNTLFGASVVVSF